MTIETAAARTAETSADAYYHSSDPTRDFACSRTNVDVAGQALRTHATERNPGPNPSAVHPWERCGLGVAPYKLVGAGQMTYQATPDAPVQPGTCCDFCGQGIVNVYFIRAACGSAFKVGCDCVRKACSKKEGVYTQVEKARKKHEAELRAVRDARKTDEIDALIAEHRDALAAKPHPRDWAAAKGETMLDHVEWMRKNCGASGRAKLLKAIKAVIAP